MLIGSFYYSWYIDPEWSNQTHRKVYGGAPRSPIHGWYNSMDLGTIEHHVKLAKEYEIDFFIISYNGDHEKSRVDFLISQFERLGMRYCIQYETVNVFNQNPIILNYYFMDKFVSDIEYLCEKYFRSENYFKIDGKPVLFIYVTRRIMSENLLEIKMLRKQIKDKYGLDLMIIGDEIWHDFSPSDFRLNQLDAVFAYNLYVNEDECGNKRYVGKDYIDFISKVYDRFYKQCKRLGVGLFPNIMPRYNDDAVRTVKGHYPLPPENGKFFSDYYEGVKKFSIPLGGEEILLVTSFNEWYEDTQIEPFWGGSNKASDEYDRNPYYGNLYLEKIREIKGSVK
jgi:hypothetical protein